MEYFDKRISNQSTQIGKTVLDVIKRKHSNLCVSVDFTIKHNLLQLVDAVGPHVCMIKTHIDIIADFDDDLVDSLVKLSKKHDFLIFEDRKFADIGGHPRATLTPSYSLSQATQSPSNTAQVSTKLHPGLTSQMHTLYLVMESSMV